VTKLFTTKPRRSKPDQTPYLNHDRRHAYQKELAKWTVEQVMAGGCWFHVVIKMATGSDDFLYRRAQYWKNEANRIVHGKRWKQHRDTDLMRGIVMFEDARDGREFVHLHIICACPTGGDHNTLLKAATALFKEVPVIEEFAGGGWRAYTERGDMVIRQLRITPEQAIDYAMKELNWKPGQEGRWRFIQG